MSGAVAVQRVCSWMNLTSPSTEFETTPGSSLYTDLAHASWCSKGFPTSSFFGKPVPVWKSLRWPTGVAVLATGAIALNDQSAFMGSNPPEPALGPLLEPLSRIERVSAIDVEGSPCSPCKSDHVPDNAVLKSSAHADQNCRCDPRIAAP
jgi:hypothetical protein